MVESFITNVDKVGFCYLQKLGVKVSKTSFSKFINENPFFPSLYSLSAAFHHFGVNNISLKIDNNKISELEPPYIGLFVNESGVEDFILIESLGAEVVYNIDGRKRIVSSLESFFNGFKNVVFLAETNERSGETNYPLIRRKEQREKAVLSGLLSILGLCFSIFLMNFIIASKSPVSVAIISLVFLAGMTICILLVVYELDNSNSFIKNICTAGGAKSNCAAVLESNASKFFGSSWSELGFIYFSGLSFYLFITGGDFSTKSEYIAIVVSLAALYIPFSIYYQAFVVKQWCLLCLGVQFVLTAGFTWSLIFYWFDHHKFSLNLFDTILLTSSFLIPAASWILVKPFLSKYKDQENSTSSFKRLFFNPDMFKSLLQVQSKAADGWQHIGIDLGNPDAENTIIKVCNPYCGPCAKAHPLLEEMIKNHPNYKLKIIFTVSTDINEIKNNPAKHLIHIANRGKQNEIHVALNDWYSAKEKNYDIFSNKYPLDKDLSVENGKLIKMKEWCDASSISYTPTIFINGWRIPDKYTIEDLSYVL